MGDNDWRSKRFCNVTDGQNIRNARGKGENSRDQITFCAFHSFLVEVQTNARYIHATHA